jgi:phosphoglycerate dehydrogenase-like enzyme
LIRPHVTGDTPEAVELALQQAMEEFDRYMNGRAITAEEVRNFVVSKAKDQDSAPLETHPGESIPH